MERGLTLQQIITELTRSPHGALIDYVPVGVRAAEEEPEFTAHLVAWNARRGKVRDAKVALPIITLAAPEFAADLAENSLAHVAGLDPRNLVRALAFARDLKLHGRQRELRRLVERYLRAREASGGWWTATALQHRRSLKTLYAMHHIKPSAFADRVLFKGDKVGVFASVARLKDMSAVEAAGTIITKKIPFLVAVGALGKRAHETELVLALLERMSPAEVVTNSKMLTRLGVTKVPALRAAYEQALSRVAGDDAVTLKTTRAAEAVEDETVRAKLRGAQEKQLDRQGVEGDWAVLVDKSSSMHESIDAGLRIAALLARIAKGRVHLVFFDTSPRHVDATGMDYEALREATRHVRAGGGTSIGCAVRYLGENDIEVDGLAIVSDGGEWQQPLFPAMHRQYCERLGKDVPAYLYHLPGDPNELAGADVETFEVAGDADFYSLPNLVATMRTNRYSLVDEIMGVPLLTLKEVFDVERAA